MRHFLLKIWLLVFALFVFVWFHTTQAYQATNDDTAMLVSLRAQLMNIIDHNNEDLRDFYYQIRSLQNKYSFDDRIDYMLTDLKNYLRTIMQAQKRQAQFSSKDAKQAFVDAYTWEIMKKKDLDPNCIWRYNTLDDIAFSFDYPTSVLIATRYRETNCWYYLPSNGAGPFQIVGKDYGTGEISEAKFVQSVIDFIKFSKDKYSRYENANSASWLIVNLSYTWLDMTGIVRHGALYNGLSWYTVYGDAQPLNPHYVRDNYTEQYSGALRFWLFPQTIRVLWWELVNKY